MRSNRRARDDARPPDRRHRHGSRAGGAADPQAPASAPTAAPVAAVIPRSLDVPDAALVAAGKAPELDLLYTGT